MDPASIIVLDSSDEESGEPKRRKLSSVAMTALSINGGPHRKHSVVEQNKIRRIKPITIATNLSREADNNNRKSTNENFAIISYSEEWEKDIQKYQQIIQKHEEEQQQDQHNKQHPRQMHEKQFQKKKSVLATVADEENSERKTATPGSSSTADSHSTNKSEKEKKIKYMEKNEISKEFGELLNACRKADSSDEMELLLQKKLIKYYECVHPDFINSKSFKKTLVTVTADVVSHPELVYLKLASIVEELNIRRKSRNSVMTNENVTSTGNEKKDNQIRRLNRALYILKKRIAKLEEMEVNFDEDVNSAYMMEERYKKRAFEIYEKICDITGESKHAHRIVRKPIHFDGTHYPEFNRTIQTFVNRTNTFPDFFDVLKCLQHCNTQYGYKMRRDEMTKIAQDAFIKIGKLLQKRRKTDLYETVSYYSGVEKDPAVVDKKLQEKLEENKRHYKKVGDIIDKFARVQDHDTDEDEVIDSSPTLKPSTSKESTITNTDGVADPSEDAKPTADNNQQTSNLTSSSCEIIDSSDNLPVTERHNADTSDIKHAEDGKKDDEKSTEVPAEVGEDDSEDEEEDEEDEMVLKENVKPDTFDDIEISDDEELVVPMS